MAAGDTLVVFGPYDNIPPSSNYATLDTITAVTGFRACLDFDGVTSEAAIFQGLMPRSYGNGGLTVYLWYSPDAPGEGSNTAAFDVALERVADGDDLDATGGSDFQTANTASESPPNVADEMGVMNVAFTNGSDMDSVVAGDAFRLKVSRNTTTDTMTTSVDLQLHRIEIRETP